MALILRTGNVQRGKRLCRHVTGSSSRALVRCGIPIKNIRRGRLMTGRVDHGITESPSLGTPREHSATDQLTTMARRSWLAQDDPNALCSTTQPWLTDLKTEARTMPIEMKVTETMTGLHHFVDPALGDTTDRPLWFRIQWRGAAAAVLNPRSAAFMTFDASGQILVEGLTDGPTPCHGTLQIDYFGEQKITYDLAFDVGERPYRYVGDKVGVNLLRPLQLIKTHTTCYGAVTSDDGTAVSRSVTHFEPAELIPFVTSFRLGAG